MAPTHILDSIFQCILNATFVFEKLSKPPIAFELPLFL